MYEIIEKYILFKFVLIFLNKYMIFVYAVENIFFLTGF
jgi:hypothetical protein